MPANKKANILALVNNITISGSTYKAGCKILEIDALSELYFDDFLNLLD